LKFHHKSPFLTKPSTFIIIFWLYYNGLPRDTHQKLVYFLLAATSYKWKRKNIEKFTYWSLFLDPFFTALLIIIHNMHGIIPLLTTICAPQTSNIRTKPPKNRFKFCWNASSFLPLLVTYDGSCSLYPSWS
jgi:hypothetical protein